MTTAAIIPVRNRPKLVVQAIRSCQAQTLPIDEIIVVDDASTDETPEVVQQLSNEDSRIRLIRLATNGGANGARNAGAALSSADWLAFLDSDDQWFADKHEQQITVLTSNPTAIACFTGIRYALTEGTKDEPLLRNSISFDDLRLMNFLGSTSTAMVRRQNFEDVGGFDLSMPSCQDWDLWLRLRKRGDFALVPNPLVLYDQSDVGRISKNMEQVLEGHRLIFERTRDGLSSRQLRRVNAYQQIRLAQIYLWDFGQARKALAAAAQSVLHRPTRMGIQLFWLSLRRSARTPRQT